MTDEIKALHLAQICAYTTAEAYSYLPKTAEQALSFQPHDWVLDAIKLAFAAGRREERTK